MKFLTSFLMLLYGCASGVTEFDREYRLALTYDKWQVCRSVYMQQGVIWVSTFHYSRLDEKRNRVPDYLEMQMDLGRNNCRLLLKKLGYE